MSSPVDTYEQPAVDSLEHRLNATRAQHAHLGQRTHMSALQKAHVLKALQSVNESVARREAATAVVEPVAAAAEPAAVDTMALCVTPAQRHGLKKGLKARRKAEKKQRDLDRRTIGVDSADRTKNPTSALLTTKDALRVAQRDLQNERHLITTEMDAREKAAVGPRGMRNRKSKQHADKQAMFRKNGVTSHRQLRDNRKAEKEHAEQALGAQIQRESAFQDSLSAGAMEELALVKKLMLAQWVAWAGQSPEWHKQRRTMRLMDCVQLLNYESATLWDKFYAAWEQGIPRRRPVADPANPGKMLTKWPPKTNFSLFFTIPGEHRFNHTYSFVIHDTRIIKTYTSDELQSEIDGNLEWTGSRGNLMAIREIKAELDQHDPEAEQSFRFMLNVQNDPCDSEENVLRAMSQTTGYIERGACDRPDIIALLPGRFKVRPPECAFCHGLCLTSSEMHARPSCGKCANKRVMFCHADCKDKHDEEKHYTDVLKAKEAAKRLRMKRNQNMRAETHFTNHAPFGWAQVEDVQADVGAQLAAYDKDIKRSEIRRRLALGVVVLEHSAEDVTNARENRRDFEARARLNAFPYDARQRDLGKFRHERQQRVMDAQRDHIKHPTFAVGSTDVGGVPYLELEWSLLPCEKLVLHTTEEMEDDADLQAETGEETKNEMD